ncbi:MAG: chorismate-binding protein, partial [Elusimicrobia bacterium]|nr:chorismate-binding protein [Elusimicrobiota bacterium]
MARAYSVVRHDLGLTGLDGASCLERLLRPGLRGFLIEKDEAGRKRAWLGAAPFEMLTVERGKAYSEARGRKRPLKGNPFEALGRRVAEFKARGGEAFDCGAVGLLGYEMVRHLERVPVRPERYEAVVMLFAEVLVVEDGRASLRSLARTAADRRKAKARAAELRELLRWARPVPAEPAKGKVLAARGRRGRAEYMRGVRRIQEHIRAGDIFQGVLSDDFEARLAAGPIAAYRAIRAANPTPYLFLLMGGEDAVLGASPERLVRVVGGRALNCPIAGTRPRGKTAAKDRALERELRASAKERAEHLMLVDLARNDLGRVCAPGSVRVQRFMFTKRFSNVMHLV